MEILEYIAGNNKGPGKLPEIMENFTSLCSSTEEFVKYFRLLITGKENEMIANFEKIFNSLNKIVKLLYNINTYIANLSATRKTLEDLFRLSQQFFPEQRILAIANSSPALLDLAIKNIRDSICCCSYIAYKAAYRSYRSMEPYLKDGPVKSISHNLLSIFYLVSTSVLQESVHG